LFLGLDNSEIKERLTKDLAANGHYYLGIILALTSAALDTGTYLIIRKVGGKVPNSMIPFISGLFTTPLMLLYTIFYAPLDWFFLFRSDLSEADTHYRQALLYALGASILAWVALEFMCIGL
jgi:drug/metabolite transporter (DMT)-like permease